MKRLPLAILLLLGLFVSSDLAAQGIQDRIDEGVNRAAAGDMQTAMLGMVRDMHGIVVGISSVDDVKAAEPRIEAVFDRLVASIEKAMKSGASMQDLEGMLDSGDPEIERWSQKMDALSEALEAANPEAAAALESVLATQGMRLMTVVMKNMSPEDMAAAIEGTVDTDVDDEEYEKDAHADVAIEYIDEFDDPVPHDPAAAARVKNAMIEMTKRMYEVVAPLESTDDVESAEGEITLIFDGFIASVELAMQSGLTMRELESIINDSDPEVKEWNDRMEALTDSLRTSNPEAAAALEGVMQKQGMRLMSVVMANMSHEEMVDGWGLTDDEAEGDFDLKTDTPPVVPETSEDLRVAMLAMTKRMYDIVEKIESVDDVKTAEADITAVFDDFVAAIDDAMESGASMQSLEVTMNTEEGELKEWNDKIEVLTDSLKVNNPEAAAALEQLLTEQGMRLISVVMKHRSQ